MKIKYFEDTDTVLLYVSENEIVETKEADEDTYLDFDADGKLASITIEHFSQKSENKILIEGIEFEELV